MVILKWCCRVNPKWVIFHSIVSTDRQYLRNVISIEPSWLTEAAPQFYQHLQINPRPHWDGYLVPYIQCSAQLMSSWINIQEVSSESVILWDLEFVRHLICRAVFRFWVECDFTTSVCYVALLLVCIEIKAIKAHAGDLFFCRWCFKRIKLGI